MTHNSYAISAAKKLANYCVERYNFSDTGANANKKYLKVNGDQVRFSTTVSDQPWYIVPVSASSDEVFLSIGETVAADRNTGAGEFKRNHTLLQWGTNPNELSLIMYPDEMDLEDSRFHWKIINPFDAMLFKYPDGDLGGQIMYDFEYYEAWLAISNATKFEKNRI